MAGELEKFARSKNQSALDFARELEEMVGETERTDKRADRGRAREDYQKGTGWNDQRGPERTKEDQGRTPAIRVCTSRWNRSSLKIEVSIRVSWIQVVSRLKHFNFLLHLTKREQTANETK